MDSATATVEISAPWQRVFDYVSRIETVPEWATEFVEEFDVRSSREARARTSLGEVIFRIESDAGTGVIDMYVGPTEDQMALFPARVVPLDDGRSAFIFTMFRGPGQTEERFRSEHRSLQRELENLVRRFSADAPEER